MKVYIKRSGCGWCHGQGWFSCDSDYDEDDGDVQCISDCTCLPDMVVDEIAELETSHTRLLAACQAVDDVMVECPRCEGDLTDPDDHKGEVRCGACNGLGEVMDDDEADTCTGAIHLVREAIEKVSHE